MAITIKLSKQPSLKLYHFSQEQSSSEKKKLNSTKFLCFIEGCRGVKDNGKANTKKQYKYLIVKQVKRERYNKN